MVLLVLALLVLGGALYYLLKSPASGSTSAKTRPAIGALFTNRLGKGLGDWLGKWRSPPLAATNSAPAPARGSSLAASVRQTRKVVREVLAIRQSAEETDSGADNDKRTADVRKLPASTDHVSSPQDAALASAVGAGKTEAIVWPEIEITALVGSGSRGSALINGDFLTVGEANDADVTLVEIEPQAALLEFKGQRRRIPVKKR